MLKGRPLTTGHYETREELEMKVWEYWLRPGWSCYRVGRRVGVSAMTVSNILNQPRHPRKERENYDDKL